MGMSGMLGKAYLTSKEEEEKKKKKKKNWQST